ncbi:enolase C-terminal domain-like protein [Paraburkholderia sp. 2C]
MTTSSLTIRSLTATAVSVPMRRTFGTSAQTFNAAPLLLVTLETNEGITGHGYAFCYLDTVARAMSAMVADLSAFLAAQPVCPLDIGKALSRYFKLTGLYGPLCMLASAIDTAAWDALALAANVPLATLLGGSPRPIPAYNSNGLGLVEPPRAADEAEALLADGFRAVKMRLGRASFGDDLAAVRAVRKRLPDDVVLMTDFNQALSIATALEYCPMLDGEGVYWIEEPIRHDSYAQLAQIAARIDTPVQLGENFVSVQPVFEAAKADASDYLMFDLDRIGGVSGWRLASGIAASVGREVSSHLFPEVSAHLLAATPTAHWLEYVDWADAVLEEPLRIEDGFAVPTSKAGNGLSWNEAAIEAYRID